MTRTLPPAAKASTAAEDKAGTDDRPDRTQTPARKASSLRAAIPAQNAALSHRSR